MAASQTRQLQQTDGSSGRRTVASYPRYQGAERAVDWLSDKGFAVEQSAIVGRGVHTVEQVTGRVTVGRAALTGAGEGATIGALFALLFGIFFTGPDFAGLLLYAVAFGALFGALFRALAQWAVRGRRDFASTPGIEADRYEVQVDDSAADEATRLLAELPARNGAR